MRILVVDDHALFREAVVTLLAARADDPTVFEAADADEARRMTSHYRDLDLILLDHAMPGLRGVDAIPSLRENAPGTPILVVSAHDEPAAVRGALAAGADGYVTKSSSSRDLLAAISVVLGGEQYVAPQYLGSGSDGSDANRSRAVQLTERQFDVLRLIAAGLPNKTISQRLGITEATVKLHVSAILRELRVRNRTEAVAAAIDLGLLA